MGDGETLGPAPFEDLPQLVSMAFLRRQMSTKKKKKNEGKD